MFITALTVIDFFCFCFQIGVGNILETRKKEVILVTPTSEHPINMTDEELKDGREIEEKIVSALIMKHREYSEKQ